VVAPLSFGRGVAVVPLKCDGLVACDYDKGREGGYVHAQTTREKLVKETRHRALESLFNVQYPTLDVCNACDIPWRPRLYLGDGDGNDSRAKQRKKPS